MSKVFVLLPFFDYETFYGGNFEALQEMKVFAADTPEASLRAKKAIIRLLLQEGDASFFEKSPGRAPGGKVFIELPLEADRAEAALQAHLAAQKAAREAYEERRREAEAYNARLHAFLAGDSSRLTEEEIEDLFTEVRSWDADRVDLGEAPRIYLREGLEG